MSTAMAPDAASARALAAAHQVIDGRYRAEPDVQPGPPQLACEQRGGRAADGLTAAGHLGGDDEVTHCQVVGQGSSDAADDDAAA